MSMAQDSTLSVIENPDVYGNGCNFKFDKINFGKGTNFVQVGLPNFIQSYFDPGSSYHFTRSGNCTDRDVQLTINKTMNIDSVKWDFGDGQNSRSLSPEHHYNTNGQVVFSTKNISEKWDGTYKGKAMAAGVYPWSIIYINGRRYTKWLKGTVLILH